MLKSTLLAAVATVALMASAEAQSLLLQQVNAVAGVEADVRDRADLPGAPSTFARVNTSGAVSLSITQIGRDNRLGLDMAASAGSAPDITVESHQEGSGNRANVAATSRAAMSRLNIRQNGNNHRADIAGRGVAIDPYTARANVQQQGEGQSFSLTVRNSNPGAETVLSTSAVSQEGERNATTIATQNAPTVTYSVTQAGVGNTYGAAVVGASATLNDTTFGDYNQTQVAVEASSGTGVIDTYTEGSNNRTAIAQTSRNSTASSAIIGNSNSVKLLQAPGGGDGSNNTVQVGITGNSNAVGSGCGPGPASTACSAHASQTGSNHFANIAIGRSVQAYNTDANSLTAVMPTTPGTPAQSERNVVSMVQMGMDHSLVLGIRGSDNRTSIEQTGSIRNDAVVGMDGSQNNVSITQGQASTGRNQAQVQVLGNRNSVSISQPTGAAGTSGGVSITGNDTVLIGVARTVGTLGFDYTLNRPGNAALPAAPMIARPR